MLRYVFIICLILIIGIYKCLVSGRFRAISGHNLRQNVRESGLGSDPRGRWTEGAAPY